MKKQLLSSLFIASTSIIMAQLDSSAFNVVPSSGLQQAQYITAPITSSLQFTDDFTLECWIFVPSSSSQEIHLIESYFGNTGGYVLRLSQTNTIKGYAMGASQPSLTGSTVVSLNAWNHVAVTYKTSTGELKVFLNGVQDGMSTPNISIYNNATTLKIGARGDDSDVNDQLYIDEVRMWNISKTESEIANDMNNCLVGDEAGLVLYYDFENETLSGTVTDRTSNNNDGTIVTNLNPYSDGVFDCTPGNLAINEPITMKIALYPNPTSSNLTIETYEVIESISIFNIRGSLVQQEKTNSFSVEALPAGIYIVNLATENGFQTMRFIKE